LYGNVPEGRDFRDEPIPRVIGGQIEIRLGPEGSEPGVSEHREVAFHADEARRARGRTRALLGSLANVAVW